MEKEYYKKECKGCEYYSEEEVCVTYEDDPSDEFWIHCTKPFCVKEKHNDSPTACNILGNPWFAAVGNSQTEPIGH